MINLIDSAVLWLCFSLKAVAAKFTSQPKPSSYLMRSFTHVYHKKWRSSGLSAFAFSVWHSDWGSCWDDPDFIWEHCHWYLLKYEIIWLRIGGRYCATEWGTDELKMTFTQKFMAMVHGSRKLRGWIGGYARSRPIKLWWIFGYILQLFGIPPNVIRTRSLPVRERKSFRSQFFLFSFRIWICRVFNGCHFKIGVTNNSKRKN